MASNPTQIRLILDGRAEYIEDGDTVLVLVYVMDPELELGYPGHVEAGTCKLLYRNKEVRSIEFDKRFGNGEAADGDFIFQFLHPPFNSDMSVSVEVELPGQGQGTSLLKKTFPVTKAEKPFIPLQQQLDTVANANGELRSKMRMEEEI